MSILRSRDLRGAIRFLEDALALTLIFAAEHEGEIVHAQVRAGAGRIFLSPDHSDDIYGMRSPEALNGTNQCVYLVIDGNVDDHAQHAQAAGAATVSAPHDTDYGGREYSCRDPEGHIWSIGTYPGEPDAPG